MTETVTVTIDRSGLSLSDLVIDSSLTATYTLAEGGLGRIGIAQRETFADDSAWVDGRMRVAVVKEESALPLVVRVQASTSSALDTAVVALETALCQFTYTVTMVVDGVSKVWTAYPAAIGGADDGLIHPWQVEAHYADLSIRIPLYPVAA